MANAVYGAALQALIAHTAQQAGINPNIPLAVAPHEGGFQGAVGDNGTSFGPFQLHIGGALPAAVAARGTAYAKQWANSAAGIQYAVQHIASVVGNTQGPGAVKLAVTNFERPAAQYVAGEVSKALNTYSQLLGSTPSFPGPASVAPTPPVPPPAGSPQKAAGAPAKAAPQGIPLSLITALLQSSGAPLPPLPTYAPPQDVTDALTGPAPTPPTTDVFTALGNAMGGKGVGTSTG